VPARRRQRQKLRAQVREQHRKAKVLDPDESQPPRSEKSAQQRLQWLGRLGLQLLQDGNPRLYQLLKDANRLYRHLWLKQQRALDRLHESLASGVPWAQAVENAVNLELAPESPPNQQSLGNESLPSPVQT
jgi:transposase InsO family protein